jgi:hypothetical protein
LHIKSENLTLRVTWRARRFARSSSPGCWVFYFVLKFIPFLSESQMNDLDPLAMLIILDTKISLSSIEKVKIFPDTLR